MTTIDDARVARILAEAKLRKGSGSGINGQIDACIMQCVDYIAGGDGATDHPPCADVVITAFAIQINDAPRFAQWRDELKPYAVRIAGTRPLDAAAEIAARERRRYMCADWVVRTIAPLAFEFWADLVPARREEALGLAAELRAVTPIINRATSLAAQKTAQKAQNAASVAKRDAAAANAAAYAAAREKALDFSRKLWDLSLAHLDALIKVTEAPC